MPGVRLGAEERHAIEVALARDEPFATMRDRHKKAKKAGTRRSPKSAPNQEPLL